MKQALRPKTECVQAIREAIMACRQGGTLVVLGVIATSRSRVSPADPIDALSGTEAALARLDAAATTGSPREGPQGRTEAQSRMVMVSVLERASGVLVMGFVLLDVFLTVLYARIGTGLIAERAAHLAWMVFHRAAEAAGTHRGAVLSFCGPMILLLYILLWAAGLTLGAGLIIHPGLGTGVQASNGPTPTDLLTALYAGGSSMAIVGASDFRPTTDAYRLIYLVNSLIGMSVTSLVLTYVMQVYGALRQRNTLGLQLHILSAETSDAGALLARLGPHGQFSAGYSHLVSLSDAMAEMKETHHFYPVLFYFRFRKPIYSVSAQAYLVLDTTSLIRSALAGEDTAWLKDTAAVEGLWRVAQMLVVTLETTFLPGDPPDPNAVDPLEGQQWRAHWERAVRRLADAGIAVARDEAAAQTYIDLRAQWWPHIARLAPAMAYRSNEIEAPGSKAFEERSNDSATSGG